MLALPKLQECGSIRILEQIIKINKLSLREVETLVRHLEVYVALSQQGRLSNNTIFGYKTLTVLAIAIYSIRPKLGNAILSQTFDAKDVGNILGKTGLTILAEHSRPDEMELMCYMICSNNCKTQKFLLLKEIKTKKYGKTSLIVTLEAASLDQMRDIPQSVKTH